MAERADAEPGLIDSRTAGLGGPRTGALLDRLDKAVAWNTPVRPVVSLPECRGGEKGGRPAWPALTMLKCILPARWFGLSEPQLEECLQDRLSFRRFVGLSLGDGTPDETTFVRFRARLRERGLERTLFAETLRHLDTQGLPARDGTLVDAAILEQARGRGRGDGTGTRDTEASFTRKNGGTCHGCKGSVAAGRGGIVTDRRFSDAAPHAGSFIDELTGDGHTMVVADSACRSVAREAELTRRGVDCAIMFKRRHGPAATADATQKLNRMIAQVRAVVEHTFAWIRNMGHRRVQLPRATKERVGLWNHAGGLQLEAKPEPDEAEVARRESGRKTEVIDQPESEIMSSSQTSSRLGAVVQESLLTFSQLSGDFAIETAGDLNGKIRINSTNFSSPDGFTVTSQGNIGGDIEVTSGEIRDIVAVGNIVIRITTQTRA